MIYQWKSYQYPVDAQIVGAIFEQIEEEQGGVTPASVVETARPFNSELHTCFEWDDAKAGEKWRETQASQMIRCLVIKNPVHESDPDSTIRAFVNITSQDDKRFYVQTMSALSDGDYRHQVFRQALNELQAFQRKYKELQELAEVFTAIQQVAI